MLLATPDNRLIYFDNYEFIRAYDGPKPLLDCSRKGCYLECLPGFEIGDNFSFVVWSLEEAIYLVNLNSSSLFPLIQREIATLDQHGQRPFFFRGEALGIGFYFTSKGKIKQERVYHHTYKMIFEQDFF